MGPFLTRIFSASRWRPCQAASRSSAAPSNFAPLDSLRPEQVAAVLDTLRQSHDFVVVDLPRALVGWIEPIVEHADELMVVTDISVASIRHCRRLIDFFTQDNPALPVEVIVNHQRRPFIQSQLHREAARALERKLDHWLPHDPPRGVLRIRARPAALGHRATFAAWQGHGEPGEVDACRPYGDRTEIQRIGGATVFQAIHAIREIRRFQCRRSWRQGRTQGANNSTSPTPQENRTDEPAGTEEPSPRCAARPPEPCGDRQGPARGASARSCHAGIESAERTRAGQCGPRSSSCSSTSCSTKCSASAPSNRCSPIRRSTTSW